MFGGRSPLGQHLVLCRTGEIGIRMAFGAERGAILQMVLREVLVPATVGLCAGLRSLRRTCRVAVRRVCLYGLTPQDPMALAPAAIILPGAVLIAGYAPARRASRIDPVTAPRVG